MPRPKDRNPFPPELWLQICENLEHPFPENDHAQRMLGLVRLGETCRAFHQLVIPYQYRRIQAFWLGTPTQDINMLKLVCTLIEHPELPKHIRFIHFQQNPVHRSTPTFQSMQPWGAALENAFTLNSSDCNLEKFYGFPLFTQNTYLLVFLMNLASERLQRMSVTMPSYLNGIIRPERQAPIAGDVSVPRVRHLKRLTRLRLDDLLTSDKANIFRLTKSMPKLKILQLVNISRIEKAPDITTQHFKNLTLLRFNNCVMGAHAVESIVISCPKLKQFEYKQRYELWAQYDLDLMDHATPKALFGSLLPTQRTLETIEVDIACACEYWTENPAAWTDNDLLGSVPPLSALKKLTVNFNSIAQADKHCLVRLITNCPQLRELRLSQCGIPNPPVMAAFDSAIHDGAFPNLQLVILTGVEESIKEEEEEERRVDDWYGATGAKPWQERGEVRTFYQRT
ncbi:uncharacterized protein E0L32_001268 [Thyridium curvatum]|uniref:F-box domain-containing protein n=1 Tax=Thyridium curvatum TaxID=1093900 RepID=A0A507AYZ3_9PEZI|nr:uncharacterized protein E0L32_001268 [Thyridium curvatum]TPX10071.1 hypothetical protein E0L32_001268 [Thyridium curvatum]